MKAVSVHVLSLYVVCHGTYVQHSNRAVPELCPNGSAREGEVYVCVLYVRVCLYA